MDGQLSNVSSSGGVCPLVSVWKISGGYGGGGASCGPGGGGGAGYHGLIFLEICGICSYLSKAIDSKAQWAGEVFIIRN